MREEVWKTLRAISSQMVFSVGIGLWMMPAVFGEYKMIMTLSMLALCVFFNAAVTYAEHYIYSSEQESVAVQAEQQELIEMGTVNRENNAERNVREDVEEGATPRVEEDNRSQIVTDKNKGFTSKLKLFIVPLYSIVLLLQNLVACTIYMGLLFTAVSSLFDVVPTEGWLFLSDTKSIITAAGIYAVLIGSIFLQYFYKRTRVVINLVACLTLPYLFISLISLDFKPLHLENFHTDIAFAKVFESVNVLCILLFAINKPRCKTNEVKNPNEANNSNKPLSTRVALSFISGLVPIATNIFFGILIYLYIGNTSSLGSFLQVLQNIAGTSKPFNIIYRTFLIFLSASYLSLILQIYKNIAERLPKILSAKIFKMLAGVACAVAQLLLWVAFYSLGISYDTVVLALVISVPLVRYFLACIYCMCYIKAIKIRNIVPIATTALISLVVALVSLISILIGMKSIPSFIGA
ncbi:hypothetical protein ENBRE01_0359 [Enteropsectra breve]|nr:hypothetical protein ENBRE01_0359 [Enteropsectra breve]